MDGTTVLWIVVGVIVVLILLMVLTTVAKKSNQRSTEQVTKEQELQTKATTAQVTDLKPQSDETDADKLSTPADEQQAQPPQPGPAPTEEPDRAPTAEPDRATTPHTATWGADVPGGPGVPAPVRPEDVAPVIDEEGDGCPADMDSEHFGGVLDGKRPQ